MGSRADRVDVSGAAPSLRAASRVWAYVGLNSFGGPAGQIAVMHRVLVEEKRWIGESRFLHALNYCMLLPGPEAQQLAVYVGWLLHGVRGGLIAGALFVLPGFVTMLGLSILYAGWHDTELVGALFYGVKAAVLAIVVEALLRIGRRALHGPVNVALAVCAFLALFLFAVPFPLVVFGAGVIGWIGSRLRPDAFAQRPPAHAAASGDGAAAEAVELGAQRPLPHWTRALRVLALGLVLWFAPLLALAALTGTHSVFVQEGLFFSKTAVVTFGGAYAVLAYVAQQAVERYQWISAPQMLDGLGLAETTPGPLILVLQFVAFLGAYNHPGALHPMAAGCLGAAITVWVTFVPCFLWIFLGAPYVEALRGVRALDAALSAITAAVVGVIANLAVWFAVHTLFAEVGELHAGVVRVLVPRIATLDYVALAIAVAAMVAMLRFKVGMLPVLGASALAGLAWKLA